MLGAAKKRGKQEVYLVAPYSVHEKNNINWIFSQLLHPDRD